MVKFATNLVVAKRIAAKGMPFLFDGDDPRLCNPVSRSNFEIVGYVQHWNRKTGIVQTRHRTYRLQPNLSLTEINHD